MKTTFLAMILACTLAAGALNAQQPAQPGTGGGAAQGGAQAAPEIKDPNEWTNLAKKSEFGEVKAKLAAALPKENHPDIGGKKGKGAEEK